MGDAGACARRDDLAPGSARCFDVNGHRVAVVRIGDDFYAIGDTCSHADYSLSEGDVWDDELEIECPKHGSTFSLVTGEPQTLPATQPVPVYEVVVEGDDVKVVVRESQAQTAGPDRPSASHGRSRAGGRSRMSTLRISGLKVRVAGQEILHGVDLEVRSGRGARAHGAERLGQVDAVARAHGPRRLRGDRRVDHDRRRGARPPPHVAARSAGCSSRCSTRWRCPASRWSNSSVGVDARPQRRRRWSCTTPCWPRRPRSVCAPSSWRAASTTSSPAASRSAPRPCSSRCCNRSSRSSTRSTPGSTSTRCATSRAASSA